MLVGVEEGAENESTILGGRREIFEKKA